MICFLIANRYGLTSNTLLQDTSGPKVSMLLYDDVLARSTLPRATYVFSDIDRLSTDDLINAARLYRRLQDNGCRVLNDPARVRTRFALLRGLYLSGLNPINAYRAEAGETPQRFPVFIRVADGHDPPLSDLIFDQTELDRTIEAAIMAGIPRSTILIVEYAAEPIRPGMYRKLSMYKVGDHLVSDVYWHGSSWKVKGDQFGLADEQVYDEELKMVRDNCHALSVEGIFAFASIEYGRVDFSFVGGKLCVYEINTSPTVRTPGWHPAPQRVEAGKLKQTGLLAALHAIDSEPVEMAAEVEVAGISLEVWDRVRRISHALCLPHIQLSKEHMRRGELDAALRCAEAAVADNSNSVQTLLHFARVLVKHKRFDEAIAAAGKAIDLAPKKGVAMRELGNILYHAGHFPAARERLIEAITKGDESGQSHVYLSRVYKKLGDNAAAVEAVQQAARLAPEHPNVKKRLSELGMV